jgi:hypothetical protein
MDHSFELVQKIGNKIWLTKHDRSPAVAKRKEKTQKNNGGVQILVSKGRVLQGSIIYILYKKLQKHYNKQRPV